MPEAQESTPTETTPEAPPADIGNGNPGEFVSIETEMARAMDAADEPHPGDPQGGSHIDLGDDPPAPEEQASEEAKAEEAEPGPEPEPKPEDDKKKKPRVSDTRRQLAGRKRRQDEREAKQNARQQQLEAREQALQGLAEVQKLISSGQRAEGIRRLAELSGASMGQVYLDVAKQATGEEAKDTKAEQLTPEQIEAKVLERIKEERQKEQAQLKSRHLQGIAADLSSISRNDKLKQNFPFLGSMNPNKLTDEMVRAVEFVAGSQTHQHLLHDVVGLARELETIQKSETAEMVGNLLKVDSEALVAILKEHGFGLSPLTESKAPGAPSAAPAQPKPASAAAKRNAPRRTTLSDSDSTISGGDDPGELAGPELVAAMAAAMNKVD